MIKDGVMGKKILVTGGAGHVGSHVVEQLVADKSNHVISLDNYSNGSVDNQIDGADYRRGDTNDIASIVPEEIDIVFHLGEYARIAPSFDEPQRVFDSNIMGTLAVAEFCRQRRVKLVYAASSTRFAASGEGRHQNPYSFTKATNVDLITDYGKWYDLKYAICYFYNAFGPREKGKGKYATVIAKFQEQYLDGKPLTVTKPGDQKRNFTYVKDIARGMIMVGDKGHGDGYALNNPKAHSIIEIAQAFGGKIDYQDGYSGRTDSGDIPTKAYELGWRPTVDVLDYIAKFVSSSRPQLVK